MPNGQDSSSLGTLPTSTPPPNAPAGTVAGRDFDITAGKLSPSDLNIQQEAPYIPRARSSDNALFAQYIHGIDVGNKMSAITQKYRDFDSLSKHAKIDAIKNPNLNPYGFKDPKDSAAWFWTQWGQQAKAFADRPQEEKDAIAHDWFTKAAPFYARMGIALKESDWHKVAWTDRMLNYDPKTMYAGLLEHVLSSGVEAAGIGLTQMVDTVRSIIGTDLRMGEEAAGWKEPVNVTGWYNLSLNAQHAMQVAAEPPPSTARFPELEQYLGPALQEFQNVPRWVAESLIQQESGGKNKLGPVIPSGPHAGMQAIGPMQLMSYTARDLGVDPTDVGQNVYGGIKYLSQRIAAHEGDVNEALRDYYGRGVASVGPTTEQYVRDIVGRKAEFEYADQPKVPPKPPPYSKGLFEFHREEVPEGGVEGVLAYGAGEPILNSILGWNKNAHDQMSFWKSITPDETWQEKAGSWLVENLVQLPMWLVGGGELEKGMQFGAKFLAEREALQGIKFIPNLSSWTSGTKIGKLTTLLLSQFGEGSAYGFLARENEDKTGAWKDGLVAAAFATPFALLGEYVRGWKAKAKGPEILPPAGKPLAGYLPAGDPDKTAMEVFQAHAEQGAQGKRYGTWEETLSAFRRGVANVAAAAGPLGLDRMFNEAMFHLRFLEREGGMTEDQWTTLKRNFMSKDPARYQGVFSMAEMVRSYLHTIGTSFPELERHWNNGNKKPMKTLYKFLKNQFAQAIAESGLHVDPMAESGAQERAALSGGTSTPAQELAMIRWAEESRHVEGPENVSKNGTGVATEAPIPVKSGKAGFMGKVAKVIPRFVRKGRYSYDPQGNIAGYSMSAGLDWTVAKAKAAAARGWTKAGEASAAFWKKFADFHDDKDTMDPKGFVGDLLQYFNPIAKLGLQWEGGKSGTDYTNFLGYMYHFKDNLPKPIRDKLFDILINSPKMQDILHTRRITEDQLEFFGQAMVNHVDMFTRSKWYQERGERHVFRSTQPQIGESTKWQKDLLRDMQKREMAEADQFFPGKGKAVTNARNAYKTALLLFHADENEAFMSKYPKDKLGQARLGASLESAKGLRSKAKWHADRSKFYDESKIRDLYKQHQDLMKNLGKDYSEADIRGPGGEPRESIISERKDPQAVLRNQYRRTISQKENIVKAIDNQADKAHKTLLDLIMNPRSTQAEINAAKAEYQRLRDHSIRALKEYLDLMKEASAKTGRHISGTGPTEKERLARFSVLKGRPVVFLDHEWMQRFNRSRPGASATSTLFGLNAPRGRSLLSTISNFIRINQHDSNALHIGNIMLKAFNNPDMSASIQFVNTGKDWKSMLGVLHEEWTHNWQIMLHDAMGALPESDLRKTLANIPDGMKKHLAKNYPRRAHETDIDFITKHVWEASAKLLSQHPRDFNMTTAEAGNFLFEYLLTMQNHYGQGAIQILDTARGYGVSALKELNAWTAEHGASALQSLSR